jgi:hypothetical protein
MVAGAGIGGKRRKMYPLDEIRRLAEQIKQQRVFPPPGWVTNHEAAQRLGVSLASMTNPVWKWCQMLRECGRCVRHPNGGRCNVYWIQGIDRIIAAREAADQIVIPQGFVDKEGACRMFGVNRHVWKRWIREGKVRGGEIISASQGARRRLYPIEDLERLKQKLFGEDKLYKDGKTGLYHVPEGWIDRHEACERFGVSIAIWWRWEREKKITCGERVPGGPKLYRIEDVNRMLDEYGRWAPPYPDPDRPNVYRVPLSGRDIKRREAIIDAESLPLLQGRNCNWSVGDHEIGSVAVSSPEGGGSTLRRLILGVTDPGLNVRHINGDPLDCRRENLVVRTVRQRSWNTRKMKRNSAGLPCTSQFKGVYWERQTKKWVARISTDGKAQRLGRFGSEIAAAEAYDEAAKDLFGEHARLNFPDGIDAWLEQEAARRQREDAANDVAAEQREAA